ncbi:MAG: NINE protein [Anaerolineae bacterium]|jgi:TM2 domain-containing membrane protein YozV
MHCTNCGAQVGDNASVCTRCGFRPRRMRNFCWNCGAQTNEGQAVCVTCGVALGAVGGAGQKSRLTAGLLAIFLGGLGIHKFYLGYNKAGIIMLLVSIVGLPLTAGIAWFAMGIVSLIEGIIYLTKSDDEFDAVYVQDEKPWF